MIVSETPAAIISHSRNSSFELLRIFSMLLIVMHHYVAHGGFDFVRSSQFSIIYLHCLLMGGEIGVNLFVLISGYFLCKIKQNLFKVLKLELQVLFYSVAIGLIFLIFAPAISPRDVLKIFLPFMSETYWFYNVYFLLYLSVPFLNIVIGTIDKRTYRILLLFLSILWSVIPTISSSWGKDYFSMLGWFILLYFIGAYVRLYKSDFSKTPVFYILVGSIFYILNYAIVFLKDLSIANWLFRNSITFYAGNNKIFIYLSACFIFLAFSKWNLQHNRFINIVASSTFGIYLIHDNPAMRTWLWKTVFHNQLMQNSNWLVPHSIFAILCVYIGCSLIDLVRGYIEKKVFFSFFTQSRITKIATHLKEKLRSV